MTEQVMGSVSITILGDNGFAPFRRQARIAHAQRDSAVASSVSPATIAPTTVSRSSSDAPVD
jgi:hypothetical protein